MRPGSRMRLATSTLGLSSNIWEAGFKASGFSKDRAMLCNRSVLSE